MQEDNIILIHADASNLDSLRDLKTTAPLRFRRGDTVTIDALLKSGGSVSALNGFRNATLEILDIGKYNTPAPREINLLAWKRVESFESPAQNPDGTTHADAKHLRFVFSKEESLLEHGEKWLRLYADFEGGKRVTFASGWICVDENYGADASLTPMQSPEFIGRSELEELYYSRTEMEQIRAYLEAQTSYIQGKLGEVETFCADAESTKDEIVSKCEIAAQHASSALSAATTASDALQEIAAHSLNASNAASSATESAQKCLGMSEDLNRIRFMKKDRDGFQLNGGQLIVPTSINNTGMRTYAPFTIGITISDFKGWGEGTGTHRTIIGNHSYFPNGFLLAYEMSGKQLSIRYAEDSDGVQNVMYYTVPNFTFDEGVNTLTVSISDEFANGCLPITIRKNGKVLSGSHTAFGLKQAAFRAGGALRIGGSTTYYVNSVSTGGIEAKFSRFAFFGRVLTDDEIQAYETGEMPENPAMLLDGGAGAQWRDISGNGNHANLAFGEPCAVKHRDTFINNETMLWTASGTKYFLSSTEKILPDNCKFNVVLTASVDCSVVLKNGANIEYANIVLFAGVPEDLGSFINIDDGKISLRPSVSSVTINTNIEIRKL